MAVMRALRSLAPRAALTARTAKCSTSTFERSRWTSRRLFSSENGLPEPSRGAPEGFSHWRAFGYPYMLNRGWGVASRVCSRWSEFIDYYEQGVFARNTSDEARSRMFVLTCMPRATTVDLFEFMTGATHAMRTVYDQLYADNVLYPDVHTDFLEEITSNASVLTTLKRKPLRLAQQFAVHAEPRKTKLVLEQLDINHVGLKAVDYHMQHIPESQAKKLGYHEDEWLRLEVAYDVVEHIRVSSADDSAAAIEDHKTFENSFVWTFETNVSDPAKLDWRIVDASDFTETEAMVKRTARSPLG